MVVVVVDRLREGRRRRGRGFIMMDDDFKGTQGEEGESFEGYR